MMTGVGVILGTAAYMSPGAGEGAARRTSAATSGPSGVVLYEMLTGRRAVRRRRHDRHARERAPLEPNWEALPSDVPPAIRTLLQSCLVKDRRRRVADISTALFVLDKAASLAAPAGRHQSHHCPADRCGSASSRPWPPRLWLPPSWAPLSGSGPARSRRAWRASR